MAFPPGSGPGLTRAPSAVSSHKLAGLFFVCVLAAAQTGVTFKQAQARGVPDLKPALSGSLVTITGTLVTPPVLAVDSYLLGASDGSGYGLVITGTLNELSGLAPGDRITATGLLTTRAGMPVLAPSRIDKLGAGRSPSTLRVELSQIGLHSLGLDVVTEGKVIQTGSDDVSDYMVLRAESNTVRVVLPKTRNDADGSRLARFNPGDTVRATGLVIQNCPLPPHDKGLQIVAWSPAPITLLDAGQLLPGAVMITGLGIPALVLAIWWLRGAWLNSRRNALRSLNALADEIVVGETPREIVRRLAALMPRVSSATGARLYVYNKETRLLDRIQSPADPDPLSINPDSPSGALATAASLAFRNRSLLNIPDTLRSPYFKAASASGLPRSAMFVPMFAQDELIGVLEADHADRIHYFSHKEQAAVQHLANQVGTWLKSREQRAVREQLFRGEKLAATGELISGIASELRLPLENILATSSKMLANPDGELNRELRVLAAEAQRASEIVARLVSFGRKHDTEVRAVELNDLISRLTRFREREWKAVGIDMQIRLASEPLYTTGAQGQLEQVLLNVLVHAEQSLLECPEKTITISTTSVGRRAFVEIAYAHPEDARDPFEPQAGDSGLGLAVSRGMIQSHGGEARFTPVAPKLCKIEIDLPMANEARPTSGRTAVRRSGRTVTTLVVDPETSRQRRLVKDLAARDHRVVPVTSAEEGIDLVQRLRFDVVVCSIALPGLNWIEFLERIREQIGAFVLAGDGLDPDPEMLLPKNGGFVLSRPGDEAELDRVLNDVEAQLDRESAFHARA